MPLLLATNSELRLRLSPPPSTGEPCRVGLRERPRRCGSPTRALPATSSCASGPRTCGGGVDLGHTARGCTRTTRLLPFAVHNGLQMDCALVLSETLAAVFAQGRTCLLQGEEAHLQSLQVTIDRGAPDLLS